MPRRNENAERLYCKQKKLNLRESTMRDDCREDKTRVIDYKVLLQQETIASLFYAESFEVMADKQAILQRVLNKCEAYGVERGYKIIPAKCGIITLDDKVSGSSRRRKCKALYISWSPS